MENSTIRRPAAGSHWLRPLHVLWGLAWLCYSLPVGLLAARHVSREHFALFWDDALFFERVAYNIIHHGFAGWNQADGPVFVNTSQLFQLLATGLLWSFPGHYNAAVVFWGALALSLTFVVLLAATRPPALGAVLLFFLLQAPPVLLSLTTGMETPTVFLVLAVFLWVLLRDEAAEERLLLLGALQCVVYLVRPDAILLSMSASGLVLLGRYKLRQALYLGAGAALGIVLISVGFHAYYGTAFPLSTFLKVTPLSSYDQNYLSMGLEGKLTNLAQTALMLLPLVPLIAQRRDRVNGALCAAGLLFIGFHALTTYEIAAYHARFYAPSLPFFFAAALRSISSLDTRRKQVAVLLLALSAAVPLGVLYSQRWIENARGYGPDIVTAAQYVRYALGVPVLALTLLILGWWRARAPAREAGAGYESAWLPSVLSGVLVCCVTAQQIPSVLPPSWTIASDELSNTKTIGSHTADVGIDVIRRCFPEPFQLTHSEIGLPGVLFPESRIIDFTGLANPRIVDRTFDFEALCTEERPEFIFRPHWTHRALNKTLDASACLRERYTAVRLPRRSSCPLLVRKDLFPRYVECSRGQ